MTVWESEGPNTMRAGSIKRTTDGYRSYRGRRCRCRWQLLERMLPVIVAGP